MGALFYNSLKEVAIQQSQISLAFLTKYKMQENNNVMVGINTTRVSCAWKSYSY